MNPVTIRMDGLKELDEALLDKAPKQVRAIVRPSLAAAGDWMAALIRQAAPRNTSDHPHPAGELESNIESKVSISARNDEATVTVGPSENQFYAYFVEFGHRLVKGGYSRVDSRGRTRGPGKEVGNVPPHPFMRPTFDTNAEGWLEKLVEELRARLDL